jgi:hypothetical protein
VLNHSRQILFFRNSGKQKRNNMVIKGKTTDRGLQHE